MNHKISEINIEAFRAYNKLQRFDFRHRNSGSAADLVVIYAPNGYGKTSFFDAVEWAVTGTIGRFEKNKIIKQEMGTEKVDILKNRFSSSPQGTVQIVVENGEVFEKKTAKRKGRMNNDYREGEIEVIPPGLSGLLHEKMSFCLTNMLAHDKITTFLQNYSDEDKTKALKGFWDENRVFDSLDTITQLVGQVVQKKKGLSKEIEKGEKELKQYTFENSIESNLVEAIIKFNKHSADLKIDEKTSEDFENISIEVSSILKKIQDWKYSNKEKLSTIEVLLSGYSDYLSNREKLDSVKKEKEKCENKLDLINKVDTLYKQAEELEVEQKILLKVINDWDKFQKIEEELKQIIDSNVEIGKLTQSVNQDISNMNQLMHDCEQRKIKISHSKGLKEKELNIIRENSQRAFDYRKSLQKTYRIREKVQYILELRKERRLSTVENINRLERFKNSQFSNKEDISLLSEVDLQIYEDLKVQKVRESSIKQHVKVLEEQMEGAMLIQGKADNLLLIGRELIEKMNASDCPLCHAKYNDFSELISKVSIDGNFGNEIEPLVTKINQARKESDGIFNAIKENEMNLNKSVDIILGNMNLILSKQTEKVSILQHKLTELDSRIEYIDRTIQDLTFACADLGEDLLDFEKTNFKIESLDREIHNLSEQVIGFETEIEKCFNGVLLLKTKQDEVGHRKVINDQRITALKDDRDYREVSAFLLQKNLKNEFYNLTVVFEEVTSQYERQQVKINEVNKRIEKLAQEIDGTKEELGIKLEKYLLRIIEVNVANEEYQNRASKVLGNNGSNLVLIDMIKSEKESILLVDGTISEKIAILNEILDGIRALREQLSWSHKKKELERQKNKYNLLTDKLEKLESGKKIIEEFIVEKTNEHFNSEIINQIYKKIDPHPSMNHIKFVVENKNGLKTHIYTYDNSEEDKMSPVLYLSSAQVNILSLSIFLAKVLAEDKKTLNTIFIDDPIQHLDGVNLLAFIDLLRAITTVLGRQIVISTYNSSFYNMLKIKMDDKFHSSKFIELNSVGEIKM